MKTWKHFCVVREHGVRYSSSVMRLERSAMLWKVSYFMLKEEFDFILLCVRDKVETRISSYLEEAYV